MCGIVRSWNTATDSRALSATLPIIIMERTANYENCLFSFRQLIHNKKVEPGQNQRHVCAAAVIVNHIPLGTLMIKHGETRWYGSIHTYFMSAYSECCLP